MRVFVKSYGCSANLADSEVLLGCILEAGYEQVNSILEADIVIVNSCAVKGPTENRIISKLKNLPKNKKIIVAGCLPVINFERLLRETRFDGLIGPAAGDTIVNVIQRVIKGETVIDLGTALVSKPDLSLPSKKSNPVISAIPVNYGCLGSCTYCCVVFARGDLRSYSIPDIVNKVKKELKTGTKEFWITSQDVGCYGKDIETNIIELLQTLCNIKGTFYLRLGMINPNMVLPIIDDLIAIFQNSKMFKFLHLPVQSGDDFILKKMNRFYSTQDFKDIITKFRAAIPEITIATDVICGFPGENLNAFSNTIQLLQDVKPDIVNVSKFFPRPKTEAKKMKDNLVDLREIKRRTTETANLARLISIERNKNWKGWIGDVLIDEKGKISCSWIGRNFAYKPVVVKSLDNLLGKTFKIKIEATFPTYLSAKIC